MSPTALALRSTALQPLFHYFVSLSEWTLHRVLLDLTRGTLRFPQSLDDQTSKATESSTWKAYVEANQAYAQAIVDVYQPGDMIWCVLLRLVQDVPLFCRQC